MMYCASGCCACMSSLLASSAQTNMRGVQIMVDWAYPDEIAEQGEMHIQMLLGVHIFCQNSISAP